MTERRLFYGSIVGILLFCIGLVWLVVVVVGAVEADHDEPAPEPQTETVETVNRAEHELASSPAPVEVPTLDGLPLPGNGPGVVALVKTIFHADEALDEIRDGYMAQYWPAGFDPEIDIYMGWKEKDPRGWANLVRWGRGEEPPGKLPPPMEIACKLAAAAQNIDEYLAHYPASPLGSHGREFALAGYHHGVNPYLLAALTAAESTFATDGSLCRTHHNAWGMKGPNKTGLYAYKGWMYWEDWPSAIDGAAYFISVYWPGAWTAYDLRGYCAGNPPEWVRNVEIVREGMGGGPW